MGVFTAEEYRIFAEAEAFLWTTRVHLHLLTGRATEQLTFDTQVEIAATLGYRSTEGQRAVERFMQDYFTHAKNVGDLTRIFLAALEARHVKPRPSLGDTLRTVFSLPARTRPAPASASTTAGSTSADEGAFRKDPVNILRLFEEALRTDIPIHPDALRRVAASLDLIDDTVRADREANRIFLDLLLGHNNPERALRRMNEVGVLGAFIPEFGRIVAMMQFNMYHYYTVDEHIIRTDLDALADRAPRARRRPADRHRHHGQGRRPPRPLRRAAPARHRQGLGPRPLGGRRRGRGPALPALRPRRRGDRARDVAGAEPPADVRRGAEARPRRAAHRARLRPGGEEPDPAEAPDRAHRLRHPRRRAGRLEQLEGDAAARPLRARRSSS